MSLTSGISKNPYHLIVMFNFFLFTRKMNILHSFSIVFSYDYWDFFILSCSIFCSLSFAIETMSCCFPPMLMIIKIYFSLYSHVLHSLHIAVGYFSVSCWWWWFSSNYLSLKDQCSFTSVPPPCLPPSNMLSA